MGFDPRRWRPSSGSRPLTTNVEALLAENEALRREVRSLRLQLEAFLQGAPDPSRPWEPMGAPPREDPAASAEAGVAWSSSARSRASRPSWSSSEPPRSRVTVGSSHGLSADLVERWGRSLARHPRWQALRIGPPGGLRGLEEELRRHWWNPALSLEQELDRRCPGLGHELFEALRGPHSRGRWAVRAAFALYGPRAPEWLSEEPLRVVDELLRRVQQLEQRAGTGARQGGTRTASGGEGPEPRGQSGDRRSEGAGSHQSDATGRRAGGSSGGGARQQGTRQQGARQQGDGQRPPYGAGQRAQPGDGQRAPHGDGQRAPHDGGGHHQGQQRTGTHPPGSRRAASADPRAEALALLGLEAGASAAAIKRAYRRLAKAHHPDLGGDADAFRRLDAAYRLLR